MESAHPKPAATKVSYADPGEAAASFRRARTRALPAPDLAARLRQAIEAADLWVLHEIDAQMLLRRGGYAMGPPSRSCSFTRGSWRACSPPILPLADPAAAGHVMPRDADLSVLSLQVQVECIRSAAARSQL